MNTDTIIQNTFGQVMTNAAQAMSDAVKQYGPDAVELGLVVYRISALQEIVIGFLLLIGAIVFGLAAKSLVKKGKAYSKEVVSSCRYNGDKHGDPFVFYTPAGFTLFGGGVLLWWGLSFLSNMYNWAALLGYPEVLITYKALVAAGLM